GVRFVKKLMDELAVVGADQFGVVVSLVEQVFDLLRVGVEEHRVRVHLPQEVLPNGFLVLVELDLAVLVVQVEHRVQCVLVQAAGIGPVELLGGERCHELVFSFKVFSVWWATASTSAGVPKISKSCRLGTSRPRALVSRAEITLPARQYPGPK